MTFEIERFQGATLTPRQATVKVPDLAHFFSEGADPVFIVRGLTGEEIARSNDISTRQVRIAAHINALASASAGDQTDALKNLLGYGDDVPDDLAKRLDHLVFGCVVPTIDRPTAVKLFATYPIVAYTLTNRILEMTGMGPDLGKAPPSMSTPM